MHGRDFGVDLHSPQDRTGHQPLNHRSIPGIATQKAMIAHQPEIARTRDRGARGERRNPVGGIWLGRFDPVIEQKIELGGVEPSDLDIEVQIRLSQTLQLDLEDLPVLASQLGQPVVGNHIGPALGIGHMVQPNRGVHPRDRDAWQPRRGRGRQSCGSPRRLGQGC